MSNVIPFHRHRRRAELERLNRLTGLEFRHWPESLLSDDTSGNRENSATTRLRSWR